MEVYKKIKREKALSDVQILFSSQRLRLGARVSPF